MNTNAKSTNHEHNKTTTSRTDDKLCHVVENGAFYIKFLPLMTNLLHYLNRYAFYVPPHALMPRCIMLSKPVYVLYTTISRTVYKLYIMLSKPVCFLYHFSHWWRQAQGVEIGVRFIYNFSHCLLRFLNRYASYTPLYTLMTTSYHVVETGMRFIHHFSHCWLVKLLKPVSTLHHIFCTDASYQAAEINRYAFCIFAL